MSTSLVDQKYTKASRPNTRIMSGYILSRLIEDSIITAPIQMMLCDWRRPLTFSMQVPMSGSRQPLINQRASADMYLEILGTDLNP